MERPLTEPSRRGLVSVAMRTLSGKHRMVVVIGTAWTVIVLCLCTCRIVVSTSAFLACHQCWSEGSSLSLGLNFRDLVCGIF